MLAKKLILMLTLLTLISTSCNTQSQDALTDPVQLTWFSDISFWSPPKTWSTDESTVQGAITKATGVTFKMDIPPKDGVTQLRLKLTDGTLPDVISIYDPQLSDELIKSGKVWKLEELLKEYDPDSHLLNDFPQDIKEAIIYNEGDWYSFPSHINSKDARVLYPASSQYFIDSLTMRSNWNILFNGDLMEKAGITLDDVSTELGLLSALEKVTTMNLTVHDKPVIPLICNGSDYQFAAFAYLTSTFGAMPIDPQSNYRDLILAPEYKYALRFLNTVISKGYLDSDFLVNDTNDIKEYIADERVFCFIGNVADIGYNTTATKNWVTPGALLSLDNKTPVLGIAHQAGSGWLHTFISKDCKYPERVAKWLSYMSSKEGLTLGIYGFEGVDYTIGEDGLLFQTDIGLDNILHFDQTGVQAFWPFHNISFSQHVLPAPTDETNLLIMEVECAFGKDVETKVYDSSLLFIPTNLIDPSSDLGIAEAQISIYKETQITKIILAQDSETFETLYTQMIDTLYKYGIKDIDAIKNEAVQKNYERYGKRLTSINGE